MYVDLKLLKENIGKPIDLVLKSNQAPLKEIDGGGKRFNVWVFKVLKDNEEVELEVSDSLKRKLEQLDSGQRFMLSWEEFTKNAELRNYWKVDKVKVTPPAKVVNEFEKKLESSKTETQAAPVVKKFVNEGARFGMIFNNTMKLFMYHECSWTKPEFVANFDRVEKFVDACEKRETSKEKENKPVHLEEKDLPFNNG